MCRCAISQAPQRVDQVAERYGQAPNQLLSFRTAARVRTPGADNLPASRPHLSCCILHVACVVGPDWSAGRLQVARMSCPVGEQVHDLDIGVGR